MHIFNAMNVFLTEEDACKRCCRPTQNSTCRPIEPTEILRDGTPCIHGYCENVRTQYFLGRFSVTKNFNCQLNK